MDEFLGGAPTLDLSDSKKCLGFRVCGGRVGGVEGQEWVYFFFLNYFLFKYFQIFLDTVYIYFLFFFELSFVFFSFIGVLLFFFKKEFVMLF